MYYAKSTCGFYSTAIHGDAIPADAVEITAEEHAALLDGQSMGKRIVADLGGRPMLSDPPAPTIDEIAATYVDNCRAIRDKLLDDVLRRIARYWSQVQGGITPTESAQVYALLLAYAQDLRDVPQQVGFPDTINWPIAP